MQDLKNYRIDDIQKDKLINDMYFILCGCKNYSLKNDQHLKAIAKLMTQTVERSVNSFVVDAVLGKQNREPCQEYTESTPREVLRASGKKGVISVGHKTILKQ